MKANWRVGSERRSRRLPALANLTVSFSPPEELIIKKLENYAAGGSEKHLRDIAAMLRISGEEIDFAVVGLMAAEVGLAELWKATVRSTESR